MNFLKSLFKKIPFVGRKAVDKEAELPIGSKPGNGIKAGPPPAGHLARYVIINGKKIRVK
ncbi:MAG TPA: hypothetical protein VN922_24580 [Bacteroidia bacterium]|nr:hypothetical protein [Bacteroidia bacterium]